MTTTTQREVRSQINGRVPHLDSPGAPARARASMTDTKRDVKAKTKKSLNVGAGLVDWWVWTAQPTSFRQTWSASKVDRTRVPSDNTALRLLWHASNWTDRLVMFALILTLPTFLTGPLRWCATRPTRRYGLYLTVAAFVAAILIGV